MSRTRARELALPLFLIVAILVATAGAALALNRIEAKHERDVVRNRLDRSQQVVDRAFREPLERLSQVAAGIEAGGGAGQRAFTALTRQMMATPEVGAVGYVERVPQRDRARWEREHHLVMKAAATADAPPAPDRPVHYVVRAVIARAAVPPGTDLGSDPARVTAMRRSASLGEATFTPPVPVFGQDERGLQQLVAFQPIGGGAPGTRYVSATFIFGALADKLRGTLPMDVGVTITDGQAKLAAVGDEDGDLHVRHLALGGRDLTVRTRVDYSDGTPWDELVLIAGLLSALGVLAFAVAARRRVDRFDAQAGARLAERIEVEADLDRERGFSATLISALPDGFVAADNRGIIVVNDAMCELTGFSRRELMGRLFPHGFWPEDSMLEVQRLRDHVAETGSAQMELTLRTKDDDRVPVLVSASRVDGRHGPIEICLVRDNRERAEATRRLTESEAQLRSLANAATDMVVRLSRAERIEWVSPSAEVILGFTPDELEGRRFSDLFEREGLGRIGADGGVYRLRHKDGHAIWAEATVSPTLDSDGGIGGMRASIRDVTEREAARAHQQRTEARYRRVAELLPDAIVLMVGPDRRFTMAAGGGLEATDYRSADLEGKTLDEVLASPEQQRVLPYWEAAMAGREGEVAHTGTNGREYLMRFVPLSAEDGAPDGALVVTIDVTLVREMQSRDARDARPDVV